MSCLNGSGLRALGVRHRNGIAPGVTNGGKCADGIVTRGLVGSGSCTAKTAGRRTSPLLWGQYGLLWIEQ